jgi:hypothetical protein
MYGPGGKANYDELAIGAKSKFAINEYPDGLEYIIHFTYLISCPFST